MIKYTVRDTEGNIKSFRTKEQAQEFLNNLENAEGVYIIERRTNGDTEKPETYT